MMQNISVRIVRTFHAWCRYQGTVGELSCLPDCVLADLGISRAQIRGLAWRVAWQDQSQAFVDEGDRVQAPASFARDALILKPIPWRRAGGN